MHGYIISLPISMLTCISHAPRLYNTFYTFCSIVPFCICIYKSVYAIVFIRSFSTWSVQVMLCGLLSYTWRTIMQFHTFMHILLCSGFIFRKNCRDSEGQPCEATLFIRDNSHALCVYMVMNRASVCHSGACTYGMYVKDCSSMSMCYVVSSSAISRTLILCLCLCLTVLFCACLLGSNQTSELHSKHWAVSFVHGIFVVMLYISVNKVGLISHKVFFVFYLSWSSTDKSDWTCQSLGSHLQGSM